MARVLHHPIRKFFTAAAVALALASGGLALVGAAARSVGAATVTPTSASWCSGHGSSAVAWAPTAPALPICGPGPAYGGSWSYVDLPGPFGSLSEYFNATPGFQCVELAERYLAVVDGLAPVKANGAQVAMNYHAAYPSTSLITNGSASAVGHAPGPGDVISVASSSGFGGDGHVAVVTASSVNGSGDGTVTIAQQNVAAGDYLYTLDVSNWRLFDPQEPSDALFQFPDAQWLVVPPLRTTASSTSAVALTSSQASLNAVVTAAVEAALVPHAARRNAHHSSTR